MHFAKRSKKWQQITLGKCRPRPVSYERYSYCVLSRRYRQHDQQAYERDRGTRQRQNRIEPVIPLQVGFQSAHLAVPQSTFRRQLETAQAA